MNKKLKKVYAKVITREVHYNTQIVELDLGNLEYEYEADLIAACDNGEADPIHETVEFSHTLLGEGEEDGEVSYFADPACHNPVDFEFPEEG